MNRVKRGFPVSFPGTHRVTLGVRSTFTGKPQGYALGTQLNGIGSHFPHTSHLGVSEASAAISGTPRPRGLTRVLGWCLRLPNPLNRGATRMRTDRDHGLLTLSVIPV